MSVIINKGPCLGTKISQNTFPGILVLDFWFLVPCYLTRSLLINTGPSVRTNSPELSESGFLVWFGFRVLKP